MLTSLFYSVKPLLPRWLLIELRRQAALWLRRRAAGCWPIWDAAGAAPAGWTGWPQGKRFALVLTHDVESAKGAACCERLADLEQERGFRSSFGFVPLRYHTPERLRKALRSRGFEVVVHDLYHDGRLYQNRKIFEQRRPQINNILREWQCRGFSSGSMLHSLSWIAELDIDFDMSTYDVDPFEPQSCGVGRIFPFWVQPPDRSRPGFVELPYTLMQDFTLFLLLRESNDATWRHKLDWIVQKGGMALVKVHPDYVAFNPKESGRYLYPAHFYTDFLDYIRAKYDGQFWLAHPSEVADHWRHLQPVGENGINASPFFCRRCRRTDEAGWLKERRPSAVGRCVPVAGDPSTPV